MALSVPRVAITPMLAIGLVAGPSLLGQARSAEQGPIVVTPQRAPGPFGALQPLRTARPAITPDAAGEVAADRGTIAPISPAAQATPPQPAPAPVTQAAASSTAPSEGATAIGVTSTEVKFGLSAPLSGPSRDIGRSLRQGIEAAFSVQNDGGGVAGRRLTLVTRDDAYEPGRAADVARALHESDGVFATVGDIGTATAKATLPYALEMHMPKLFPFTGADELRSVPPDRIVFNLRASYGEETAATVRYLINVRGFHPNEIAVFAQDDDFGASGIRGVERAMRGAAGGHATPYAVVTYKRNTMDVADAVTKLRAYTKHFSLKAIVMVATYKAAAQFIAATRPFLPGVVYTDVSFAGSSQLAEELAGLGHGFGTGVVVTQVVPDPLGHSREVENFRAAMATIYPGEQPDYVSLEGWLDGRLLIEGLGRAGRRLTPDSLADALESIKGYDLGMGKPIGFTPDDHQASHYVWGTVIDANGRYVPLDMQ